MVGILFRLQVQFEVQCEVQSEPVASAEIVLVRAMRHSSALYDPADLCFDLLDGVWTTSVFEFEPLAPPLSRL